LINRAAVAKVGAPAGPPDLVAVARAVVQMLEIGAGKRSGA